MQAPQQVQAVAMTREIRDMHYRQTAGMSSAERLAFYREQGRKAHQELQAPGNKDKFTEQ